MARSVFMNDLLVFRANAPENDWGYTADEVAACGP